jgi:alkylhydroperoxidase family enzyme
MARVTYKLPAEVVDPQVRAWLERSIKEGRPGPEIQAIRAHHPGVMASFNQTRAWVSRDGLLEDDLIELMRAYVAVSAGCSYCADYGKAKIWQDSPDEQFELLNYAKSTKYTPREKLALRYADAIMWDPALADDELWAQLLAEFNEPEVVELGYWIGFTYGGQRWIKTLDAKHGELNAALQAVQGSV